ncbi:MAG TPA: DUF924 family protein [Rhizobiaceae bacterium]|nr:DUF924 family protein [Rhizobiaceae bacterium]
MGDAATLTIDSQALEVTRFWREAGMEKWFPKSDAFDDEFRAKFLDLHFAAARREKDHWAETPEGMLALMILLDQFPRNCFRNTGHMYATDPLARMFARQALADGFDQQIEPPILRLFFYLPLSHSENIEDQEIAVRLNMPLGDALKHAVGHWDIVKRFGRFPHRNPMLGRDTTPEEQAFLDGGGFKG